VKPTTSPSREAKYNPRMRAHSRISLLYRRRGWQDTVDGPNNVARQRARSQKSSHRQGRPRQRWRRISGSAPRNERVRSARSSSSLRWPGVFSDPLHRKRLPTPFIFSAKRLKTTQASASRPTDMPQPYSVHAASCVPLRGCQTGRSRHGKGLRALDHGQWHSQENAARWRETRQCSPWVGRGGRLPGS
jgi:hypothetical protein